MLRNILLPAKPGEKTYTELIEALSKHYIPFPSETVERYKFRSRVRKAGESIANYVAELRYLSEYCKFGAVLNYMIGDRLVCGVNDAAIQKRLLVEPALKYDKAVEPALSAETAAQSVRELQSRSEQEAPVAAPLQGVHKTGVLPSSPASSTPAKFVPTCYHCGRKGHTVLACRIDKNIVCRKCQKKGHLQRACKSGQSRSKSKSVVWGKVRSRTRITNRDYSTTSRLVCLLIHHPLR